MEIEDMEDEVLTNQTQMTTKPVAKKQKNATKKDKKTNLLVNYNPRPFLPRNAKPTHTGTHNLKTRYTST